MRRNGVDAPSHPLDSSCDQNAATTWIQGKRGSGTIGSTTRCGTYPLETQKTGLLLGELVGASDWSCPEYRPLMFAAERAIRSLIENKQQARSECSVGSLVAVEACDKICVFRRKVIGFGRGYSVARRTGEGS